MKYSIEKLPRWPEDCKYGINKATPMDCDYTECSFDGSVCDDVSKCKYLRQEKPYAPTDYQCEAMRTADPNLDDEKSLLEGLIGLNSEAGEALDIYKKHIFQKHDLDREKIALELGDALWYLTEAADAINYTLTDIMQMNIRKLQKRYPNGFDPERSKNREM